jgi:hypothetical protein
MQAEPDTPKQAFNLQPRLDRQGGYCTGKSDAHLFSAHKIGLYNSNLYKKFLALGKITTTIKLVLEFATLWSIKFDVPVLLGSSVWINLA